MASSIYPYDHRDTFTRRYLSKLYDLSDCFKSLARSLRSPIDPGKYGTGYIDPCVQGAGVAVVVNGHLPHTPAVDKRVSEHPRRVEGRKHRAVDHKPLQCIPEDVGYWRPHKADVRTQQRNSVLFECCRCYLSLLTRRSRLLLSRLRLLSSSFSLSPRSPSLLHHDYDEGDIG